MPTKNETFEVKIKYPEHWHKTQVEVEVKRLLNKGAIICMSVELYDIEKLERRKERLQNELTFLQKQVIEMRDNAPKSI